jgi:gluconate 2-dehydrogenase gamma chain
MSRWSDDVARAVLPPGLRRREFLDLVALIAALPACKDNRRSEPAPSRPAPEPQPARALDAAAYRALEAATARILPADGAFPGAREANVMDFIDRQLAIAPLSKIAPALIAIAHAFDDAARARKAREFAALAAAQQDEVLDALSRGALGTKLPEKELFRVLHGLTLEGFLADPHHGGNKDMVAWKAIGFAEPTLRTPGGNHEH